MIDDSTMFMGFRNLHRLFDCDTSHLALTLDEDKRFQY